MVHPCYWKALDIRSAGLDPATLSEVTDEDENVRLSTVIDVRHQAIERTLQDLDQIPLGREGSKRFEEWAYRVVRILFGPALGNFELKPSPGGVNQRDIVATVMSGDGFWGRVNRDYDTRQVVFEVKNYDEPSREDLRQLLEYTSNEYGRCGLLIVRSQSDALSTSVKNALKALYHENERVILVVPSSLLSRCITKFRIKDRFEYVESQLRKKLDTHIRSTVAIRARE
jgi:hypothetical protein